MRIKVQMRFIRQNLLFLSLLIVAALLFTVFAAPYFHDLHHDGVSIAVYAVLMLAFVYGRTTNPKCKHPGRRARPD